MSGDTRGGGKTRPFKVAAEPDLVDALRAKAALYAVRADPWWMPRRQAALSLPRAAERRRAREELAQLAVTLRRKGQLLDTASAIITHHLAVELAARGWDREWDPVPAGAAIISGRRHGSMQNDGPEWSGRLQVRLDEELAEQLVRATYAASADATAALLDLADARDNDEVSPGDYAVRYRGLAKQVITAGHVLRAALIRATAEFFPTTKELPPNTEPWLWEEPELLEHIPADGPGVASAAVDAAGDPPADRRRRRTA